MPSWSVQVVEQSPSRLVIVEPSPYWIAGVVAGIGLLLLGIAILNPGGFLVSQMAARLPMPESGLQIGNLAARAMRGVLVLAATPFLVLGWGIWKSDIQTTFDRSGGLLTVDRRTFGVRRKVEIPLAELDRTTVEAGRAGRRLVVRLKSGPAVRLTGYSNRRGHYEAAQAIDNFLGRKSP